MTVTHTGSTEKYSSNWEQIFGGRKTKSAAQKSAPKPSAGKKAPAAKKTAKSKTAASKKPTKR